METDIIEECKKLIHWFWSKYSINNDREGFCQCGSENIIKNSGDPELMRSFLLIGVLIDQMMYTHFKAYYGNFRKEFKYPKIYAHGGNGMSGPNWFVYSFHGYDKKMNWDKADPVAKQLFGALYSWFRRETLGEEEIAKFKNLLCNEIAVTFEKHSAEKLLPIVNTIH